MNAPSPEPSSPTGDGRDWTTAPAYVLRSLPAHAARAGMVDDLLMEDGFLLHGDLTQLLAVADQARTERGRQRALLVTLTPAATDATPSERAALFSVTAAMEGITPAPTTDNHEELPYRAAWALTRPRVEATVLNHHIQELRAVRAFDGDDGKPRLAIVGFKIERTIPGFNIERYERRIGHRGCR